MRKPTRRSSSSRLLLRNALRVAVTTGYGPRFLHSTGQFHKGGPATGVFLQITADEPNELPIPGEKAGFAVLADAQATWRSAVAGAAQAPRSGRAVGSERSDHRELAAAVGWCGICNRPRQR